LFEVRHFVWFGAVAEGVLFGLELTGVTALRSTTFRRFPEPFPDREPGETYEVTKARLAAFRARGQEISLDWNRTIEMAEQGGIVIGEGALLESAECTALQLVGSYPRDPTPGMQELRIDVAAADLRWTRSDGVEWSVEQMHTLHKAYWQAFKERTERRRVDKIE
jgi:hypothetical protein